MVFFSVLCLLCLCARLSICVVWSPAGIGLTSWLSFVVFKCEFVTFQFGILRQVWYLIVSIPDLCALNYFSHKNSTAFKFLLTIGIFLNKIWVICFISIDFPLLNISNCQ